MRWLVLLLPLAACTIPNQTTRLAMANPASIHCKESGGKLILRQSRAGTKGYCQLRDGRTLDAWEYFRQTHP